MDSKKLFEAACKGDIEALNNFVEENPLILIEFSLTSSKESIMHVAVKAQQPKFVHELIKKRPELAYELNKDGLRPIDIASIIGNVDIVREILSIDPEIFRLEGREKRTALHYAAINGRIGVIGEFMSICSEGIKDVSDYEESAVHLALKNNQVDAFCVLLKWVERVKMEYVINWGDCDGNTALHIAASKKQLKSIKQLLCGDNNPIAKIIEVNATNSKGLTPMDLLDIVIENPNDFHLKQILAQAGALRAQDTQIPIPPRNILQVINKNNQTKPVLKSEPSKNWFEYFKFQVDRDSPSDARNALLVVAALIATVSFQAGVNPPSGMLQQKSPQNSSDQSSNDNEERIGPAVTLGLGAASALLGSRATSYLFLFANTLGLTASLSIIIYLTGGFPFQRELLMSMFSMMFSYGFSISSIVEKDVVPHFLLGIALLLPFVLRWVPWWGEKAWKWWRRTHVDQEHIRTLREANRCADVLAHMGTKQKEDQVRINVNFS